MPIATLRTVEGDLRHKITMIRDRLSEIVEDKYGPNQSDTDGEERQLQRRLAFLESELKRLNQQTKSAPKRFKYIEIQTRFKELRATGLATQKAIRQIADERDESDAAVKWAVNYKPNRK